MAIDYNKLAIPKGKTRKQLKARKDRDDAKKLKAFRDEVWRREEEKLWGVPLSARYIATRARCEHCGLSVRRGADVEMTGEVHHRIGRRHKATRWDPRNGVLLCNHMVNNCHARAGKGEIEV